MTRKEILIILLIICAIFSLQAVAAASDSGSTDDVVSSSGNVSAYSLPTDTDDQLQGGSGAVSFTQLQTDLNEGTGEITLVKNYTYSDSDSLPDGITIPTGITKITGNGIIIDANHKARVFNITSGHAITITGITFINGYVAEGNGGSINSAGKLTLENCKFINNTASFTTDDTLGNGGAVYLGHTDGDTIINCTFEGNVAKRNGGALDWYLGSSNGKVINSNFTNNTAKRSGGAIHWSGHYGTIKNSNFTNNTATGEINTDIGGRLGGGDGGAVLWVGSNGTIDNCRFIGNEAIKNNAYTFGGRGGAIFLHGNSTENCTNTTVSNSYFKDNTAGTNGGAINWQEGAHEGNILKSIFENNTANANGGAVYWRGHHGEIKDSNFTNNTAKGLRNGTYGNVGDGGAILWAGINGTVDNCRFIDNVAIHNTTKDDSGRGGAVYLEHCDHGNENTTFHNSYFENNTAGSNGGAIDWSAGATYGHIVNTTFINNTAKRSGGAIHWSGHYGEIINSTFTHNIATGDVITTIGGKTGGGDGGAVLWVGSHGLVDNCTFTYNFAQYRGGAIFLHGNSTENSTNTTISNSVFKSNIAGLNGGAVDWQLGSQDGAIINSTFTNNTAWRSGGAVYWYGFNGTVKGSNFTDNKAIGNVSVHDKGIVNYTTIGGNGGAIIWTGSVGMIDGCNFTRNTATQLGGAVYLQL